MEFREQITVGFTYFIFAYFATLGFWQLIATWQRLKALSWLGRRLRTRWGYLLGSALMGLACLWFFGTRGYEIFSPGPASSEFFFFLSAALLCSLVTSVLISLFVDRFFASAEGRDEEPYPHKEPVSLEAGHGILHMPSSRSGPSPGICIVPEPGEAIESLEIVAARLAEGGFVVLIVDMAFENSWLYPDMLIPFTKAISYLDGREEVDSGRIGVVGVGLGGDLAIRAAASDPQIRSVVAIAPLFVESSAQPGLDLLREMCYPEAIRWTHLHQGGKLVTQLEALEHIPELDSRRLLVIYGEGDRQAPMAEMDALEGRAKLELIPGQGRRGLACDSGAISSTTRWFRKNL